MICELVRRSRDRPVGELVLQRAQPARLACGLHRCPSGACRAEPDAPMRMMLPCWRNLPAQGSTNEIEVKSCVARDAESCCERVIGFVPQGLAVQCLLSSRACVSIAFLSQIPSLAGNRNIVWVHRSFDFVDFTSQNLNEVAYAAPPQPCASHVDGERACYISAF